MHAAHVMRGSSWALWVAGVLLGCTPPAPPPAAPATPSAPETAPAESVAAEADAGAPEAPAEPPALPSSCAEQLQVTKDDSACLPEHDFVKRLCAGSFPDVAISLNAKDAPWTRAWLAGDVEAWNASGARFTNPEKLVFDEEVLILSRRAAPTGGIVITGA